MESTSLDEGTGDPASAWWRVLVKEDWEKITGLASNMEWYKYPSRSKLMAFPWAVYEAKEREDPSAKEEAAVAAELLLRILNDLALVPGCPNEERLYQTPTSDCFQVFAFTSEGPMWNVYVCLRAKRTVHAVFGRDEPSFVSSNPNLEFVCLLNTTENAPYMERGYNRRGRRLDFDVPRQTSSSMGFNRVQ
jgi:hypothetical protein